MPAVQSTLRYSITKILLICSLVLVFFGAYHAGVLADLNSPRLIKISPSTFQVVPDVNLSSAVQQEEQSTVDRLIDQSTDTVFTAYGESELVFNFNVRQKIHALKTFGPSPYKVRVQWRDDDVWRDVAGLTSLDLSKLKSGWQQIAFERFVTTPQMRLILTPQAIKGGSGGNGKPDNNGSSQSSAPVVGIAELEFWGEVDQELWPNTPLNLLDKVRSGKSYNHVSYLMASPVHSIVGELPDLPDDTGDNRFSIKLEIDPVLIKKAWLTYDSYGAGHWVSPVRSINGQAGQGGVFHFASSAWTTQIEPINPEWLRRGENTIEFAVPGDEHSFNVSYPALLIELDNGSNHIESVSASPVGETNPSHALVDGDLQTGWTPYIGDEKSRGNSLKPFVDLVFTSPVSIDDLYLVLDGQLDGKIEVEYLQQDSWFNAHVGAVQGQDLQEGLNTLDIQSQTPVDGVRLIFSNGGATRGSVQELMVIGSTVGSRWNGPKFQITYPTEGEYFGEKAYIRGFLQTYQNESGAADIQVAGQSLVAEKGAFETLVSKSSASHVDADGTWYVDVKARFPDGTEVRDQVALYQAGDLDMVQGIMKATLGQHVQSTPVTPVAEEESLLLEHDQGVLELVKGANDKNRRLSITSLRARDLPPLDPGMVNVTKGPRAGYRFGPHGMKFLEKIKVKLPFDKNKIPEGLTEADIKTYYYDENLGKWQPLERIGVTKDGANLESYTDHFTDMINATITVPESPQISNFTPTSIKDIKAADPGAGIGLIEAPKASNTGDASLQFPIQIPAGRRGLQPQLAISYNSSGGSGWLGQGWDVSVPSISVDSRWGAPRYLADKETETYSLQGQMLTPVAHQGALRDRTGPESIFFPRVEGSFSKIVRHGNLPKDYWWEVTDKQGTVSTYGTAPEDTQNQNAKLSGSKGIYKWFLQKVQDTYGNTMTYHYETYTYDQSNPVLSGGKQVYLSAIDYTGYEGSNAYYRVEFERESTISRPDISVDMKGGFKVVSPFRLSAIRVKERNGQEIRRYQLDYKVGAYDKSLLTAVHHYVGEKLFNSHRFNYFDELPRSSNQIQAFAPPKAVSVGSDDIGITLGLVNKTYNASVIGGTTGSNRGWSGSMGYGFPFSQKKASVGGNISGNQSTNESYSMLMDIDGDGLPDKVFKSNGGVYFRKNITAPGSTQIQFDTGSPVLLSGITKLSSTKSTSNTRGAYATLGVNVNLSQTRSTTVDNAFISDVNADGLPDLVDGGTVKFNTASGFNSNSALTPVPLGQMGQPLDANNLLPDYDAALDEMRRDNPLMDAVKVWRAPHSGKVRITGFVSLVDTYKERLGVDPEDSNTDIEQAVLNGYTTADGVDVSIDYKGNFAWQQSIVLEQGSVAPHNTTVREHNVTLNISKDDALYFRVNSRDDGAFDEVNWSPTITYYEIEGEAVSATKDANGLNPVRFNASEDFIVENHDISTTAIYSGTIKFDGVLSKTDATSDNITVQLMRLIKPENEDFENNVESREREVLFERLIPFDYVGDINFSEEFQQAFSVTKGDALKLNVLTDSSINLNSLQWAGAVHKDKQPSIYYTAASDKTGTYEGSELTLDELPDDASELEGLVSGTQTNETTTELETMTPEGGYKYVLPMGRNVNIYGKKLQKGLQKVWIAPKSGVVFVTPWINFKTHSNQDLCKQAQYWRDNECILVGNHPLVFTAKKEKALIDKVIFNTQGYLEKPESNGFDNLIMMPVQAGETLYFDLTSPDTSTAEEIESARLSFSYASDSAWKVPLDATAQLRAEIENEFWYVTNDDNVDVIDGVENPWLAYIVRKNNDILYRGTFQLPTYSVEDPDPNDEIYFESSGRRILIKFNHDGVEGEKLYFDLISKSTDNVRFDRRRVYITYFQNDELKVATAGSYLVGVDQLFEEIPGANGSVEFTLKPARSGTDTHTFNVDYEDGKPVTDSSAWRVFNLIETDYTLTASTSDPTLSSALKTKGQVQVKRLGLKKIDLPSNTKAFGTFSLSVSPALVSALDPAVEGSFVLVVREGALDQTPLAKHYVVRNGQIISDDGLALSKEVSSTGNLYVDLVTDDATLSNLLPSLGVNATAGQFTSSQVEALSEAERLLTKSFQTAKGVHYEAQSGNLPYQLNWPSLDNPLLGSTYRGWGYIGYNANDGYQTKGIDPARLKIDVDNPGKQVKSISTAPSYFFAAGDAVSRIWRSQDGDWKITAEGMTSSRRGENYTSLPNPAKLNALIAEDSVPGYVPAVRVPKIGTGNQMTKSVGFGVTVNKSSGGSRNTLDMMDLNGDGFPDIVAGNLVQYTWPDGSLSDPISVLLPVRYSKTQNTSYSTGPSALAGAAKASGLESGSDSEPNEPFKTPSFSGGIDEGTGSSSYDLMDLNGDGLPDRVFDEAGAIFVQLSTGYGFSQKIRWGNARLNESSNRGINMGGNLGGAFGTPENSWSGGFSLSRSNNYGKARLMDVSGDGLPDYVRISGSVWIVNRNTGYGFSEKTETWSGLLPTFDTDLASGSESVSSKVYLSDGTSTSASANVSATIAPTIWIPTPVGPIPIMDIPVTGGLNTGYTVSRPTISYSDINGDGYLDMLRSKSGSDLTVALNQTGKTNLLKSVERPLGAVIELDYARSGNTFGQQSGKWVLKQVEVNDGFAGDGVDTQRTAYIFEDGYFDRAEREFYGYAKVTETPLDENGKPLRYKVQTYLNQEYATKGLLVSEVLLNENKATLRETVNEYEPSVVDTDRLASLAGIPRPAAALVRQNIVIFPKTVRTRSTQFEPGYSGQQSTSNEMAYDSLGNVVVFIDHGDADTQEDDVTAVISYLQDQSAWLMAQPTSILVEDHQGNRLRERLAQYDAKGSLTRVSQVANGSQTAHTDLSYDKYGNLQSVTGPVDANGQRRQFSFVHDDKAHQYVVRINDDNFGYYSTSEYDYRFGQVTENTDINGNRISTRFDDLGRITSITGPYEQASGQDTIRFEYHPLAKIPYARTYHLDPEFTGNWIETVLFTDGLKRVIQTKKDTSLYQGNGQSVEGQTVSGRVLYDALGRTVAQYYPTGDTSGHIAQFNPAFNPIKPTRTTYDALDRSVRVVMPDGSETRTRYRFGEDAFGQQQALTEVIDAEGNSKASYRDARQLITSVQEFLTNDQGTDTLWTRYRYDALKQIREVIDAQGNTTQVNYDLLGRRIRIDNPDMGEVTMAYDAASNLVAKTTANLKQQGTQAIEYLYHYGRLSQEIYPNTPADDQGCTVATSDNSCVGADINIAYHYGADTPENRQYNRVGRVIKLEHQAGSEERWYGKLGEMTREVDVITFDPSQHFTATTFVTRYHYDSWGRMKKLVYPDGDKVLYHYDEGGQIKAITGDKGGVTQSYIRHIQYDEFEQRKRIVFGNGVETLYTYDPERRMLSQLSSANGEGHFQNLSYQFDNVGNILSRINNVKPINGVGGYSEQHYQYDSLYRLTGANGRYTPPAAETLGEAVKDTYQLSMRYDRIHNITRKAQHHERFGLDANTGDITANLVKGTTYSWDYHYTGTQPHAPTTVGSRHFRYDANGNQLGWTETDIDNQSTTNSRRIYWDDKNRIQRINDDKYTSLFAYDDQDQRVVKYAKNNSANTAKTTYYINQYYQLSNDVLVTKHVFNGSSRLLTKHSGGAIVFRSKPRNTRSYKGRPESNLPGNDKAETHPNKKTDAIAPPLAGVKGKSAQAPGQQKKPEPAQNGKGKGQQGNNGQAKTNGHAGTAGLNGIAHRSDRANEVAQNTHKNPHLVALGLGEGTDGATTGADTSEASNPGQCDTINAGCTAGEAEDALYTGDEIVIIGSTKEQQFYYHPDHLGSTAYITDSSGQLTEHLEYFPFGETWVQEGGSKKTPYLYTGKELDQETGLYYYGARYYDPRTSIWASPDPILEKYLPVVGQKDDMLPGMGGVYNPKNLGLYAYTHQNPIVYSDPDGNIVVLIPILYAAYKAVSVASDVVDIATDIAEGDYTSASVTAAGMLDPTGITNKVRKASMAGKAVESVTDNVAKKADDYVDLASSQRRKHILDGDATGGGHRPGTGKPGKSEFPQGWSDDKIMHEISDIATDPNAVTRAGRGGRTITEGMRDGIDIRVIQERNGDIVSGFPTNVPRNE